MAQMKWLDAVIGPKAAEMHVAYQWHRSGWRRTEQVYADGWATEEEVITPATLLRSTCLTKPRLGAGRFRSPSRPNMSRRCERRSLRRCPTSRSTSAARRTPDE